MEKISKIKSIIEEGERIKSFFKDYGNTKVEYESLHPDQLCDGYTPGFNRSCQGNNETRHEVCFCNSIMRKGIEGIEFRPLLEIRHTDLFWQAFDDYVNIHKEEILKFIAWSYKQTVIGMKDDLMDDLTRIQCILDKIDDNKGKDK